MANEIRRINGSLTVVRRINGTIGSQGRVGGSINRATREYATQAKTATPSTSQQVILPDSGFDYLSKVTVNAIPYVETQNTHGTTVTIG